MCSIGVLGEEKRKGMAEKVLKEKNAWYFLTFDKRYKPKDSRSCEKSK